MFFFLIEKSTLRKMGGNQNNYGNWYMKLFYLHIHTYMFNIHKNMYEWI